MVNLDFSPFSHEFTANPYPIFAYLRDHAPVYHWEAGMGWMLTRYADIAAALADRRLVTDFRQWRHASRFFESDRLLPALDLFRRVNEHGLFQAPEADHRRIRKLIAPAFGPRAVESMRRRVERIVRDAIGVLDRRGEIDIVREFAEPVPFRVFSTVLGIPTSLAYEFHAFASSAIVVAMSLYRPVEELEQILAPYPRGIETLVELIELRRRQPEDDLLSALIHAEQDGQRLSNDEVLGIVTSLIAAGFETTTLMLCFLVRTFLEHPDQLAVVREEPDLLPKAIEEVLRYDSIGKSGLTRFAIEDISVHGTKIEKGELVYLVLPAALRDPRVFPRPDVFDVRRDQRAAMNFGDGPHTCIGMWLARLEGQIVLDALLDRFAHLRVVSDPQYALHPTLRKMASFKVWSEGPPVPAD